MPCQRAWLIVASPFAVVCLGWLRVVGEPIVVGIGLCALLTERST